MFGCFVPLFLWKHRLIYWFLMTCFHSWTVIRANKAVVYRICLSISFANNVITYLADQRFCGLTAWCSSSMLLAWYFIFNISVVTTLSRRITGCLKFYRSIHLLGVYKISTANFSVVKSICADFFRICLMHTQILVTRTFLGSLLKNFPKCLL
jgi:hypothetical protein